MKKYQTYFLTSSSTSNFSFATAKLEDKNTAMFAYLFHHSGWLRIEFWLIHTLCNDFPKIISHYTALCVWLCEYVSVKVLYCEQQQKEINKMSASWML